MERLQGVSASTEPAIVRKLHTVGRKLGTPLAGTFELTSGCNFNCGMCYIHEKDAVPDASRELSAAQWLDIGKQAVDAGTLFLLLTGGEPLLRRDFAEIYSGLKRLGLMISINTNGSLLFGETATLLEKEPPMRLNVSLYAGSPEGYRDVCGVDAFDRVVTNIRRMREAGIEVKLNVSFSRSNGDSFQQIASVVRELELHCQASVYMYPPVRREDREENIARLSPQEAARLRIRWDLLRGREDILKSSADLLSEIGARECEDADLPDEGVRCRAGHTSYWIGHTGKMMMCGMIPVECGNVPEEGFARCWEKTRALMKTVRMPSKCTGCELRPVCCVCPAACYAETGGFLQPPSYLCEMSRGIASELARLQRGEDLC